jgi:hypothetical protein
MKLSEEDITRKRQRFVDHMDRILAAGQMTQDNYEKGLREIAQWAEAKKESPGEVPGRDQRR